MDVNKPNYRAWSISEADFPARGSLQDKIRFLVGYGVLAPSTHNTQPWLFNVTDGQLVVAPDTTKLLPVGDPDGWGLAISLGMCAENISQAAAAFGLGTDIRWNKSEAAISFNENARAVPDKATLKDIVSRRSDKLPYASQPIPKTILEKLKGLPGGQAKLELVVSQPALEKITENHVQAAQAVASDPAFGQELAGWLRTNGTRDFDGMPGFVAGNPPLKSAVGKAILAKKPQLLQKLSAKDRQLLQSSSAVAVFSVPGVVTNDKLAEAGRVIERFWLKLTGLGLSAHPMFASIQDPQARQQLKNILKTDGEPVFLMRIGYGSAKPLHTPRYLPPAVQANLSAILAGKLKSHPQSHRVQVGKYDIHYVTAGKGSPLLLIHGANIGWPQWHLNIDRLAQHFLVYALDIPGAGDSTKIDFHKASFEKDYLQIVDEFIEKIGLEQVDIVGSSFGGWIAMRLAMAKRPYIRRLVLTNPIGFTKHMPMKFRPISFWPLASFMSRTALRPARNNKNLEKFMRDVFYKKDRPLMPEFIDYFYELSKQSHNALFISRLAHYSGMRKELFLGEGLKNISVPTLVIWGRQDPLMPYGTVKDNFNFIPGITVEVLEGVGHMPPVEAAPEFNQSVIAFLENN